MTQLEPSTFSPPRGTPPLRASFAGHETFPLRYAWLPKAVRHLAEDPEVFGRADALVRFGVGKNMVRAIRHWGLACKIVEEKPSVPNNRGRTLRPTELGQELFGPKGWDPFLEDPATLWVLHWQLAAEPGNATTWFYAFNLLHQAEFTKDDLLKWLLAFVVRTELPRVSAESIKRDIDCFIRTYAPAQPTRLAPFEDSLDCPLVDLGLIREFGGKGTYVLVRDEHPSLPDPVFLYALVAFLRHQRVTAKTISTESVAFAPGSPGRVFCLSEDSLMARMERLDRATAGRICFDDTAGIHQLLINELPDPMHFLSAYYRSARAEKGRRER